MSELVPMPRFSFGPEPVVKRVLSRCEVAT